MEKIPKDKDRIRLMAEKGGEKAGTYFKNLLQFTSDSIGLLILKKAGNKKLAYNVIKTGRDVASTAEKVLSTAVKTGGVIAEGVVSAAKSDKVKNAVETVKEKVTDSARKMDDEVKKSAELDALKNKISGMIREKLDRNGEFKDESESKNKSQAELIREEGNSFENKAVINENYEEVAVDSPFEEEKKK